MPRVSVDSILKTIASGDAQPIYLIGGDRVVAEPQARRIAEALAAKTGATVEDFYRPPTLGPLLADLRTYSLFGNAKVLLAIDSALLADRRSAADLVDQAEEGLPVDAGALGAAQRRAASRLLQALRVFGIDAATGEPEALIASLPDWALQGGQTMRKRKPRGRAAKAQKALREGLVTLLEAARAAGLTGFAEGDLAELGQIVEGGLPAGHALVLVEQAVAADHPLVEALTARGAVIDVGRVQSGRDGQWQGLERLVSTLAEETGVGIDRDAVQELARRTLRQTGEWRNKQVEADSTARFGAEYRKLAMIAGSGTIDARSVRATVQDRGDEDVWQILGALGEGRIDEALARFRRYQAAAADTVAARLSFFALLAGFCRQVTAVAGLIKIAGVPAGERNYNRFKSRHAPALQGRLSDGTASPVASLHPFRLHRTYLASSRLPLSAASRLPALVLETEMRVKGDSRQADAAIAALMTRFAVAIRR